MAELRYRDWSPALTADRLHEQLFQGAIVRARGSAAVAALVKFTRDFLEDGFDGDPTLMHEQPGDLAQICASAQRRFANHPEAKALWRELFEALGIGPNEAARDRLLLRFQPPGARDYARSTATVGFHRDTWGTNIAAQVNWWAPVYAIDAGRTFAFLPELFDRPIANDSADFDIAAIMRRNQGDGPPVQRGEMAPRPTAPIDLGTRSQC